MATALAERPPRVGVSGFPLTAEQCRILDTPPDRTFKCEAFAGCAKTSTSVEYAHAHPVEALYLAFNTSIAAEANGKFPPHVVTKTANAYAYQRMNVRAYSDRMLRGSMKPEHLDPCESLIRPMGHMTEKSVRYGIIKAINSFLISGARKIGKEHLQPFPIAHRDAALSMVQQVADRMLAFETSEMAFTHDVYLKAFQLRGKIEERFRYLIIDEAQDLNPVLIAIAKQSGLPCLVIGDPKQSIYRFRGAEQAMDYFEGPTFPLTQSFRFGQNVATVANFILKQSHDRPANLIRGNPDKNTEVRHYSGSISGKATILARTNMRLFESLVSIPSSFHVVGGIHEMINLVEAGFHMWAKARGREAGRFIYNSSLTRFKAWEDVLESVEMDEDPEITRMVNVIDLYQDRIPEVLKDLRRRSMDSERDARFIVSTAHKAKGREWDSVVMLDDFMPIIQLKAMRAKKRITALEYDQEINLLYVSATRAIKLLQISDPLYDEIAAGTGMPRR